MDLILPVAIIQSSDLQVDPTKSPSSRAHKVWRVAYVVPFIIITVAALGMLFFCDDTPTGNWSDRHIIAERQIFDRGREPKDGDIVVLPSTSIPPSQLTSTASSVSENKGPIPSEKEIDAEAQIGDEVTRLDSAIAEVISS
jgi:NNP family nitrate/nitrite transporter-like MFS transporter